MVEPTACAVHAARRTSSPVRRSPCSAPARSGSAHRRRSRSHAAPSAIIAAAKHPQQRAPGRASSAPTSSSSPASWPRPCVARPGSLRSTATQLTGGADVVVDCVGSRDSIAAGAAMVARRAAPSCSSACPAGQRSTSPRSGTARPSSSARTPTAPRRCRRRERRTFDLAFDLVRDADLGRLVSATYPLAATRDAIEHAANAGRRGAVKIAFDLRNEKRDGIADAPPRVRPRRRPLDAADPLPPRRGLPPREAARRAQPRHLPGRAARRRSTTPTAPSATRCCNPLDAEPLPALLRPGMKLTIAFDDISLPLPPMQRPDIRQRVIEAVLDLAADAGVDDVHLIAALALHRRMTEAELRHAVGDRVYDAFAPAGPPLQPRRRGPRRRWRSSATTDKGEEVEINKRAAESATCSSTSTSTSSRWTAARSRPPPASRRIAASATTTTSTRCGRAARSWTTTSSELHSSNWRMGEVIARHRRQGLPDRDDAQQRHVPEAVRLPAEARVGVDSA